MDRGNLVSERKQVNTAQETVHTAIAPVLYGNVSSFPLVYIGGSADTIPHCCIKRWSYFLFTCSRRTIMCCIVLLMYTYIKYVNSNVNDMPFVNQGVVCND